MMTKAELKLRPSLLTEEGATGNVQVKQLDLHDSFKPRIHKTISGDQSDQISVMAKSDAYARGILDQPNQFRGVDRPIQWAKLSPSGNPSDTATAKTQPT
jgi:hypothetical protein